MYTLNELKESSGVSLYNLAKKIIPGGTQLLSKRPEMFAPDVWPSYYSKANGCRVWDLDDREFLDMSIMSVGACILGYADEDVDAAVINGIKSGIASSLNCPEEVELGELLIDLHPWFDMVRYCRSGGEALSIAVRIARAKTDRQLVMFSGYHGWTDWYLASNLENDKHLDGQLMPGLKPNGVPRSLTNTSEPFDANSIASLRERIKGKEKDVAAIVIEPARGENASLGYLNDLKDLAKEIGAVLIFDEITSGYRVVAGGIHRHYKVYPDIAVFAKSMANGYSMATILGTSKVMQAAQKTFISSTNWTERVGPIAAIATTKKYIKMNVGEHICSTGKSVKNIWLEEAKKNNLLINVSGIDSLASFSFDGKDANIKNTLFVIEMLKRSILGFRQFKPSLAHKEAHLKQYHDSVSEVFSILSSGEINLETEPHHVGFKRLTSE